ncbi:MAG: hypothetical protein RJA57_221 [Bacteroidota bacterium]
MKQISYWARLHPVTTRVLIVAGHAVMTGLALLTATLLQQQGRTLPPEMLWFFLVPFVTLFLTYPSGTLRQRIGAAAFFVRRKTWDIMLPLLTFGMILCITPSFPGTFHQDAEASRPVNGVSVLPQTAIRPEATRILKELSEGRDKHSLTRQEKRILKAEFRDQMRIFIKATLTGDRQAAGNAGAILLVILIAIGLGILLGFAACSLACSGAEGAAIALSVLGGLGIIIGGILIIRNIRRKGPKKDTSDTPEAP